MRAAVPRCRVPLASRTVQRTASLDGSAAYGSVRRRNWPPVAKAALVARADAISLLAAFAAATAAAWGWRTGVAFCGCVPPQRRMISERANLRQLRQLGCGGRGAGRGAFCPLAANFQVSFWFLLNFPKKDLSNKYLDTCKAGEVASCKQTPFLGKVKQNAAVPGGPTPNR